MWNMPSPLVGLSGLSSPSVSLGLGVTGERELATDTGDWAGLVSSPLCSGLRLAEIVCLSLRKYCRLRLVLTGFLFDLGKK